MTTTAPPAAVTAGEFAKALRALAPIRLPAAIQILQGVKITPAALTVTNLEVTASVPLSGLDLDCLVNAAALRTVVEGFDPKKPLVVGTEDGQMFLRAGTAEAELPLMLADDYPALPEPEPVGLQLDEQMFAELREVAKAASADNTRPVLTGVRVKWDGTGLYNFAATDSYRMAIYTGSMQASGVAGGEVLIPAEAIGWLPKSDDGLGIGARPDGSHVTLYRGQATMVVRTIAGSTPKYEDFVPAAKDTVEATFTPEALAEIKRVVDTVGAKAPLRVTLEAGSAEVVVEGQGENLHRRSTVSLVEPWAGESMKIGANPAFLLSVLTYGAGRAAFVTPLRPICVEDGGRLALCMPIRLDD